MLRNTKAVGKDKTKSSSEKDDSGREQVEAQSFGAERSEKTGTYLEPDAVNEQDQREVTDEGECLRLKRHSRLRQGQCREEHSGDSQTDAPNPYSAEEESERDREGERHERRGG